MPSYVPPKKGVEYIFFIGLTQQADTKLLQSNPTIASGDFKVSIDGGAFANPSTLPSVAPASGKAVKVTLSTSEMNGDNIVLVASDASGAEWCDQIINIQTSARQIDDLCYPTVSGRSLDITTTGEAGIDWANIGSPTTTVNLSGTSTKSLQPTVAGRTLNVSAGGEADAVLSVAGANAAADALLNRNMATGTDSGSPTVRTPRQALRALRNKSEVVANVVNVYKEDDSTLSWTGIATLNSSAVPITAIDPAS